MLRVEIRSFTPLLRSIKSRGEGARNHRPRCSPIPHEKGPLWINDMAFVFSLVASRARVHSILFRMCRKITQKRIRPLCSLHTVHVSWCPPGRKSLGFAHEGTLLMRSATLDTVRIVQKQKKNASGLCALFTQIMSLGVPWGEKL